MKRNSLLVGVVGLAVGCSCLGAETLPYAQSDILPPTAEYVASIRQNAPTQPTVPTKKRRVLVFSLRTGFDHKVMPHVDRVFQILGEKSGAYETVVRVDLEALEPKRLWDFDVLVLNNNCSVGPRRNLFLDELEANPKYAELSSAERQARAEALERSLLDYVEGGKGLVVIHGAPTLLNNSEAFTGMVGAAFDYHPPNQQVTVRVVEADHPLTAAFRGKEPWVHRDEPYCFKGAYTKLDFRPLLRMDTEGLQDPQGRVAEQVRYVAWIRRHGQGRVFYCSPGHFPESYQSPTLLRFLLDGVQYVAGDLECDDSTPPKRQP